MQFKNLNDLKLDNKKQNTLENFTDVKEFTIGTSVESDNSKIIYLDDERNIVSKEKATSSVIQVFDENGIMIQEVWSKFNQPEFTVEEGTETITIYVNDNNEEVSEEDATFIVYKTVKDGKVIYEDKYSLEKKTEFSR